jgi:hypothetical protein
MSWLELFAQAITEVIKDEVAEDALNYVIERAAAWFWG